MKRPVITASGAAPMPRDRPRSKAAQLPGDPRLAGRLVHQCHVAEPLPDGGQFLLLLPRPLMGLDGDDGVKLGTGHAFEQGGALVGTRFEKRVEIETLPLRESFFQESGRLLPEKTCPLATSVRLRS